jgi:hypothetical protein
MMMLLIKYITGMLVVSNNNNNNNNNNNMYIYILNYISQLYNLPERRFIKYPDYIRDDDSDDVNDSEHGSKDLVSELSMSSDEEFSSDEAYVCKNGTDYIPPRWKDIADAQQKRVRDTRIRYASKSGKRVRTRTGSHGSGFGVFGNGSSKTNNIGKNDDTHGMFSTFKKAIGLKKNDHNKDKSSTIWKDWSSVVSKSSNGMTNTKK